MCGGDAQGVATGLWCREGKRPVKGFLHSVDMGFCDNGKYGTEVLCGGNGGFLYSHQVFTILCLRKA